MFIFFISDLYKNMYEFIVITITIAVIIILPFIIDMKAYILVSCSFPYCDVILFFYLYIFVRNFLKNYQDIKSFITLNIS